MIPNHKPRDIQTSDLDESAVFGISEGDQAHIMTILRDTLYTDKIMAVLREYSANAWDAHRMVGKGDVPIKVTLPTQINPVLSIRDFGPGLSQDEVFKIYTQYGASTKRTSDAAVGMLGIGSKSGFAYSDSFTITSYNGGSKSVYVAILDQSEKGVVTLLDRRPCGNETGIDIQIPIKPHDIEQFNRTARSLFKYFIPKPDINLELDDFSKSSQRMKNGMLTKEGGWVAVMGCIPYRINIDQLKFNDRGIGDNNLGIYRFLTGLHGALFFNIGEVQISASREELKYSDETKNALTTRFNDLIEEYVKEALESINASGITQFERRRRLWKFSHLQFAVPNILRDLLNTSVRVDGIEDFSFHPIRYWTKKIPDLVSHFQLQEDSVIVLKDDSRTFKGFTLPNNSIVVKLKERKYHEWDKMLLKFEEALKSLKIDGIETIRLSQCPFTEPVRNRKSYAINEKHRVTSFRFLKEKLGGYRSSSENWVIESRTPQDSDVFVILRWFDAEKYSFLSEYTKIMRYLSIFNEEVPEVYGYKTTDKRPIAEKDLKGTEFKTWSSNKLKELVEKAPSSPEFMKALNDLAWSKTVKEIYWETSSSYLASEEKTKEILEALGDDHSLASLIKDYSDAEIVVKKDGEKYRYVELFFDEMPVPILSRRLAKIASKHRKRIRRVRSEYPLLQVVNGGVSNLLGSESKHWINYIKLIDNERKSNGKHTTLHAEQRIADDNLGGEYSHSEELSAELRELEEGDPQSELGGRAEIPDGDEGT